MKTALSQILADFRSPKLLPALCIGTVLSTLVVIVEMSFAAMVYSGDLSPLAVRACGLTLFGSFVMCLSVLLLSTFKSNIAISQDVPAAVLSTAAIAVVTSLGIQADENVRFMTMAAIMGMSGLLTAAAFLLIGRYRLANLLRFMPYPVVGGFLAGTGWLLASGGIGVMCDVPLSLDTLGQLARADVMIKWLPGVLFGLPLFFILRRWSHFLILPGALLAGVALFYCGFLIFGVSTQQATQSGFLLSGVPENGLWPAFTLSDLADIRWGVALSQWPAMITAVFVSVLGMLMNMSGIELVTGRELDLNNEYTTMGIANGLAGLAGTFSGYISLSLSLLGFRTGAYSRLTGLFTAAIVGCVLLLGGNALTFFPKPLLGGLLLLLGMFFVYEWIFESRKRLGLVDYLLVLSIFLTVAFVGFMEGVAFGLCATIIFFIFRFSRISVIRESFDATRRKSLKQRSIPHRRILAQQGDAIVGHELNGYIFFGSASALVEQLKDTLPGTKDLHGFLLLDFSHVTGFDISAVNNFYRLLLNLKATNATLVLTTPPGGLAKWLGKHVPTNDKNSLMILPDLDRGLEWCEDALLADHEARLGKGKGHMARLFDSSVDDVMAHLARQERFEELVEHLKPWTEERTFQPGETIAIQGSPAEGMHLLVWGHVTMQCETTRLRTLAPGGVIAPRAAYEDCTPAASVSADDTVTTALLTPEARTRLESENPELALRLHRYVIVNR